jgi:hypothetical protein
MGPSFQMLWDCPTCGAKALLGVTHRHCPSCGSPQDPEARYFPEPGSEVVAEGHKWVGSDKICQYCESPTGAASAHCGNCGAALEGAGVVKLIEDPLVVRRTAIPAADEGPADSRPGNRLSRAFTKDLDPKMWIPWIVFVALLAGIGVYFWLNSTKERIVQVAEQSWTRTLSIETFGPVSGSDWCDRVPGGAQIHERTSEVRSHRKIPDGESCTDRRVDQGDGSFRIEQDCETSYRDEPVYDDWCRWTAVRWHPDGSLVERGAAARAPVWPEFVSTGDGLGARRESGRDESWSVVVRDLSDGKSFTCSAPGPTGARLIPSSRWVLPVTRLGTPRCERIQPAP